MIIRDKIIELWSRVDILREQVRESALAVERIAVMLQDEIQTQDDLSLTFNSISIHNVIDPNRIVKQYPIHETIVRINRKEALHGIHRLIYVTKVNGLTIKIALYCVDA